eukprot:7100990-Alexandrium_andersonii.AAC.1
MPTPCIRASRATVSAGQLQRPIAPRRTGGAASARQPVIVISSRPPAPRRRLQRPPTPRMSDRPRQTHGG